MRSGRALKILGASLALAWLFLPRPPLKEGLSFSTAVYDREGRLLRLTLSADDKYRVWVPLKGISPKLVRAVLAREDRRFRSHPGVDPVGLARAGWRTYFRRGRREGGSTVTMQLARLRYGLRTRRLPGKLAQILRALELERHYSKDQILEAYLNLVPYGGNVEGVGAESLIALGKDPDGLTQAEALKLSAVPQSPARRGRPGEAPLPFLAPHFALELAAANPEGGQVRSTLDLRLQRLLERRAKAYVERKGPTGVRNAAALLIDRRDMSVRAKLGSADFFNAALSGQVDGTRARRSPGSALKPFVYALGMEQGILHPQTVLKDAPSSFGGYNPENFDRDFMGPISARDALIRSRNVPAVAVAAALSSPTFHGFLKDVGIGGLREEEHYGLSLVLGSAEVTMEDLVRLYAMLGSGGVLRPLRKRFDDPRDPGRRLLSPEACALVLDILKDNPRPGSGYRSAWTRDDFPIYWKTGTSYGYRDAWAAGIFGPYVLAVWAGNFDGEGDPALVGVEAAAPLFFEIVDALHAAEGDFSAPPAAYAGKVARVPVCAVSGMIPGPNCPHTVPALFIPGRSPIKLCDVHREVLVDAGGRRACAPGPGVRSEVYEFWPSDILRLFRLAGVPRRLPPPGDCGLSASSTRGAPPSITSPQAGVSFSLRAATVGKERVPLSASADADARALFWFANERFLGKAESGEPFFWAPEPGRWVVRVVDDQGRSDARDVQVSVVQ